MECDGFAQVSERFNPCGAFGFHGLLKKASRRDKKLVAAFSINYDANKEHVEDELMKMNAIIRSNLGIDPNALTMTEYAQAYNEAVWLESFRLHNQAELLAAMFGGKKKG